MINCTVCGATNADGLTQCARCASPIAKTGAGAASASRLQDENLLREVEDRQRLRRTRKGHAAVGAVVFFLLNVFIGLPGSLLPLNLLFNLIFSILFGAPMGWLISWQRGGAIRGALMSCAAFIVVRLLLAAIAGGPGGAQGTFISSMMWGVSGLLPGAFIGFHVESDN